MSSAQEVIKKLELLVERNPQDCEALESLRECYRKAGRTGDSVRIARALARLYVKLGQTSIALLIYEEILRTNPSDSEAAGALQRVQARPTPAVSPQAAGLDLRVQKPSFAREDDGQEMMHKLFVTTRRISSAQFESNWPSEARDGGSVRQPFILRLERSGSCRADDALEIISRASSAPIISLTQYDIDIDLAKGYPAALCRDHCLLPFDRMSRCVFVATVNPFDAGATAALAEFHSRRELKLQVVFYLVPPQELVGLIDQVFS